MTIEENCIQSNYVRHFHSTDRIKDLNLNRWTDVATAEWEWKNPFIILFTSLFIQCYSIFNNRYWNTYTRIICFVLNPYCVHYCICCNLVRKFTFNPFSLLLLLLSPNRFLCKLLLNADVLPLGSIRSSSLHKEEDWINIYTKREGINKQHNCWLSERKEYCISLHNLANQYLSF